MIFLFHQRAERKYWSLKSNRRLKIMEELLFRIGLLVNFQFRWYEKIARDVAFIGFHAFMNEIIKRNIKIVLIFFLVTAFHQFVLEERFLRASIRCFRVFNHDLVTFHDGTRDVEFSS